MSKLKQLTPQEKLDLAIDYVARGVQLPKDLHNFLVDRGMLEAVTNPTGKK